jgi:hypothetical protein
MMRPLAPEIGTSDFALAAGHRRVAINRLAFTRTQTGFAHTDRCGFVNV